MLEHYHKWERFTNRPSSGGANADTQSALIQRSLGQVAMGINALKGHQSNMHSLVSNARVISRIQDTDFARESANLAQSKIPNQSALAMVAQANNAMCNILTLLTNHKKGEKYDICK